MTTATQQIYRVYIKAAPEAIWDAITKPEWTARYGYGGLADFDLRPGGAFKVRADENFLAAGAPEIIVDGEVVEADPPRKLVQTWRMLMDPTMADEGFTTLTYEIDPLPGGTSTRLTLIHDLIDAPALAAMVGGENEDQGAGGGWAWVLSDLKTLLETGDRIGSFGA